MSATGTIAPKREADLSFAVSGEVTSVSATVGAEVTKGGVLARVDRSALRIDLDAAEAAVTAAKSQLADDQDSGAADVALRSDEASLRSMQSSFSQASDALADATLRSAITGTVASVDIAIKTGQRVVLADLSAALPSSSTGARLGGGDFGGGGAVVLTRTGGAGGFGNRAGG